MHRKPHGKLYSVYLVLDEPLSSKTSSQRPCFMDVRLLLVVVVVVKVEVVVVEVAVVVVVVVSVHPFRDTSVCEEKQSFCMYICMYVYIYIYTHTYLIT